MRKIVLSLLAAGSALAVAAPASAQYYPQPSYGAPYGYNGYRNNNYGQVRALQARIDNVQRQIRFLDRRNVIRDDRADRLRFEADSLERRLRVVARNGLNPYEANDINARVARLEQRVQYSIANRGYGYNGRNGYNGYNGYNGQYRDRDRDGRDDRWEDDRGRDHDD